MSAGQELAARVATARWTDPSAEVAESIRLRVFDTLGALAAGPTVPGGELLESLSAVPAGGDEDLLGAVRRLCATTRSTEVDDIDRRSCTTPGSVAVPVALALGAALDASAAALLAAVAAGYDAMIAVGDAIDGPRALYRGIWPSYLGAPLAAAAAAASLLELDVAATTDALAIAAARVTGRAGRPTREPSSRWYLYGCAGAEGVLAAFAARRGMAGDPAVLDSLLAGAAEGDRDGADGAGPPGPGADDDRVRAVQRVDLKPFCTARQTLAAVEAARLAAAELGGGLPDAIFVAVPDAYRAMIDQPRADTRLTSIMSVQFQIAAALTEPELLDDVVRRQPRLSAIGAQLMRRISVVADAELDELYPAAWPARVTVLCGGHEVTRRVLHPDGSGEPAPDWDWITHKHERLGALAGNLAAATACCRGIDGDRRGDARELLRLVAPSPELPSRSADTLPKEEAR